MNTCDNLLIDWQGSTYCSDVSQQEPVFRTVQPKARKELPMKKRPVVGFICFGEVNTPYERLQIKHDSAMHSLKQLDLEVADAGIVVDDPGYETADASIQKLNNYPISSLVVCIAGWIPTHAVIRVTDSFRHLPLLIWGLCGWKEDGRIITTADQAGTTALRPAFQALGYKFKFIYSIINKPDPIDKIHSFITAAHTIALLRHARVGTMGYRDMLLYGTQFEGMSLRADIGIEVEPFEMLEVVQNLEKLDHDEILKGIQFVKNNWVFLKECDDGVIEKGVTYALAIGEKIKERKFEAVTLNDVDGMKKLLNFPPAMVFMLLDKFYDVQTIPENDILGNVTQLIMKYATGKTAHYMEYYEFFEKSMLIGVPDYIPESATDGKITVLPAAFGNFSASLLNVSKVKTGYVTCARLIYERGQYFMHMYTGEAKEPPVWEEFGWEQPAPQLPSLEVFPDSCSVEEFSGKVSSQHVIIAYGNHTETLRDICALMNIIII